MQRKQTIWVRLLALLGMLVAMDARATQVAKMSVPPVPGLQAEQVAIVVNDDDGNSVAVANY